MWKRTWLAVERFLLFNLIRLFRIRRQSEEVARGFAAGLMIHFYPTFGFGVVLSGFASKLVGGNLISGLVAGALFAFLWPVLFYFNVRVGAIFVKPAIRVEHLDALSEKTLGALVWGKAFTVGAIINSLVCGLLVYFAFRALYEEVRPGALAYFRRQARHHQSRFRRPRGGRFQLAGHRK